MTEEYTDYEKFKNELKKLKVMAVSAEESEQWEIKSDEEAEWWIDKNNEELTEIRGYKQRLQDKIQQLQTKLDKEEEKEQRIVENRDYYLQKYFNKVDDKLKHKTKTQEKYRLASGTIVKKYPKPEYKLSDELEKWASENSPDYVETVKKLKWGDLKKQTELVGNKVIYKPTGEVLPLKVEYSDEQFEFKEE